MLFLSSAGLCATAHHQAPDRKATISYCDFSGHPARQPGSIVTESSIIPSLVLLPIGWRGTKQKDGDGNDHFVCLLAGESIAEILKSIGEFHQDPYWQRVEKETEANGTLRSGVTS